MMRDATLIPLPKLDLALLFDKVSTSDELERALAICLSRHMRYLSFVELMTWRAETRRRLAEVDGAKDFERFVKTFPALAQRAEAANVWSSPHFVLAAVRALRAAVKR